MLLYNNDIILVLLIQFYSDDISVYYWNIMKIIILLKDAENVKTIECKEK